MPWISKRELKAWKRPKPLTLKLSCLNLKKRIERWAVANYHAEKRKQWISKRELKVMQFGFFSRIQSTTESQKENWKAGFRRVSCRSSWASESQKENWKSFVGALSCLTPSPFGNLKKRIESPPGREGDSQEADQGISKRELKAFRAFFHLFSPPLFLGESQKENWKITSSRKRCSMKSIYSRISKRELKVFIQVFKLRGPEGLVIESQKENWKLREQVIHFPREAGDGISKRELKAQPDNLSRFDALLSRNLKKRIERYIYLRKTF